MSADPNENYLASDVRLHKRLRVSVAVVLLVGVFFRLYSIDYHLYWNDEVYTSLRIAGYQVTEIEDELRDQQVVTVAEMQKYQVVNSTRTVRDTIQGLADEEPQLAPLYFVLARQWVACFGNSITAIRSLSVLFGLLALPCVYWLCREIFDSSSVGLIATALFAISPAQVTFAQEARPYSLFVLIVLVSSIALLRAMRFDSAGSWAIYAVTVVLGLYTQILFGLVAIGQAIYVFAVTRFAVCRTSLRYVIASAIALAAFLPWILVIFKDRGPQGTSWTQFPQSFMDCLTRWAGIVSRGFFDLGVALTDSLAVKLSVLPLVALVLLLILYSIYFLIRTAPLQQWLIVGTVAASIALPLLIMDIALGRRYGTTRYILPSIVGLQICMAYLLSAKISDSASSPRRRVLWQAIGVMLLLAGTISCAVRSRNEMWWNKSPGKYGDYPQIAAIVNQSDQPVVYCFGPWRKTQMICHRLDPNVHLQLLSDETVPRLSTDFNEFFLFNPTEAARSNVEQNCDVRVEQTLGSLWKLVQR